MQNVNEKPNDVEDRNEHEAKMYGVVDVELVFDVSRLCVFRKPDKTVIENIDKANIVRHCSLVGGIAGVDDFHI